MPRAPFPTACVALLSLACGSSPGLKEVTPPAGGERLYVADDSTSGVIRVYRLPLAAGAVAVAALDPPGNVFGVAVSPGGTVAGVYQGQLRTWAPPAAGTGSAPVALGGWGFPAFAPSGNLFIPGQSAAGVSVYAPPFTSATPVRTVAAPSAISAAFDAAGNLYAGGPGGSVSVFPSEGTGAALLTFQLPVVSGATTSGARGVVVVGSRLYVVDTIGNAVQIYALPVTAASLPVATLTGLHLPEGLAADAAGNLYVANLGSGTVSVYAAPVTPGPAALELAVPGTLFGIAVGK